MHVSAERFEELVREAVDSLPDFVHQHLDNVAIMVAPWPTEHQRASSGIARGQMLLGLYEGVPLSKRGRGYHLRPPDRITLFHRALEMVANDEQALLHRVQRTVVHEIAHHFGFSEDQMRELGI